MNLRNEIASWFQGEVIDDPTSLSHYSHDASIFEVDPAIVLAPKNTDDIKQLVRFVSKEKGVDATLSITARAAGTCMSGGSLTSSIMIDVTKHMNTIGTVDGTSITSEPGAFYRDLEKTTKTSGLILPSYPASKDFCAIGGMVANNCGGEKSLVYGNTERYIEKLRAVLSDGNEYEFKKLSRGELEQKKQIASFEGELYRNISKLIEDNDPLLRGAQPRVSKNTAGYLLWNVWDRTDDTFDLTRLFAGSQGTLGIITSVTFRLIPEVQHHSLLVITLPNLSVLPNVIESVLSHKPESFECYDNNTFDLAVKYIPDDAARTATTSEIPLTLIAQFAAATPEDALHAAEEAEKDLMAFGIMAHIATSQIEADAYWKIRRASFKLLRDHSGDTHRVAPFIDDIVVPPAKLREFLPRLREILARYAFIYTLAGHIGDGNFHLIPLVDMSSRDMRDRIIPLAKEVFDLVLSLGGSMAGEHNDGIIRTPFLETMYGPEIVTLFEKTKSIFDPKNIFNPGKKVGGSIGYAESHLAQSNLSKHL